MRNMRNLKNGQCFVGIDEVGRGALAGPVAVGIVKTLLPKSQYTRLLCGVRDSKKATEKEREGWYTQARVLQKQGKIDFVVMYASARFIDTYGISKAIDRCVSRGLAQLECRMDDLYFLDGGLYLPPWYTSQQTIIHGDNSEPLIALAANIAKVSRDRYMKKLSVRFPVYGFSEHKGYGTEKHRNAIKNYGLSELHRKTFCKNLLAGKK